MTLQVVASKSLVAAAIRLVADAPNDRSYRAHAHDRTLIKRSLIEELRKELDSLGFGDDWRALHKLIREEEREPTPTKAGS